MNSAEWDKLRAEVQKHIDFDSLGGKTELIQTLLNEADRARDDANFAHVEGNNAGIDLAYGNLIRNFHAAAHGKIVRGQRVRSVEVLIETHPEEPEPWYFVNLVFEEPKNNPTLSQEENLLLRVFDESPKHAWRKFTIGDLLALLSGMDEIEKYEWALEDEPAIG